jgi:alkylhydroperoxidase family enzyme
MQARIQNPARLLSDAMPHLQALPKFTENAGVPIQTLALTHVRASQINGCGVCLDMAFRFKKPDETAERLFTVAAWRDTPYFTDAERAALALAEAVTRLSDRCDPVSDEIWNEAQHHYSEPQLVAMVLHVAMTNVWNRLNVATRQIAGEWTKSPEAKKWVDKAHSASR